tara:strand:+ start:5119 stop:6306 length:1188 start_codon:yes stop_codon:yes gene_type:complete
MVTLDNIHRDKVSSLKALNVEDYERQLKDMEDTKSRLMLDTSSKSSEELMLITEQIDEIRECIKKASNNGFVKEYYLDAGDILFKYYEGIENVESTKKEAISEEGGIMSYLASKMDDEKKEEDDDDDEDGDVSENDDVSFLYLDGISSSREDLRRQYLKKIDNTDDLGPKKTTTKLRSSQVVCENCKSELSHIPSEGVVECKKCGVLQNIINDTDRASYKDPPKESCYYSYRRSNHFNEWIAQFQGKETTQIPRNVLIQVINEIKKERIRDLNELTTTKVRSILKKLKLNKYYEHIPHIINQLNGQPPPYMSRQTEEVLRIMFQKIQGPFLEFCPKKRKNFLSYSYVLHKFVELLGMDHLRSLFPLLKSREKLFLQDCIWKKICHRLGWEFHKSI